MASVHDNSGPSDPRRIQNNPDRRFEEPFNYHPPNSSPYIHENERRSSPNRDLEYDFDEEVSEEAEEDRPPPPPPLSPSEYSENNDSNHHCNENNATFDTLDEFGEDTLHALMDADLRLGAVPPLSSGCKMGCKMDDNSELYDGEEQSADDWDAAPDEGTGNGTNDSFDDGTASESLLRGPIMAARSFASMNPTMTTPSTARAHFVQSAMKPPASLEKQKSDSSSLNNIMTHSTARSTFLATTKENITLSSSSMHTNTPSNLVVSAHKPPLPSTRSRRDSANKNGIITPSAQQSDFINSPQDSISTIGSAQSVDHLTFHGPQRKIDVEMEGMTPSGAREKFISPHGFGNKFTFEGREVQEGSVKSGDDKRSVSSNAGARPTPQSVKSNDTVKSSVGRLIALGEEQMKQASAPTANETTKKSFLKKGTRKEPSALHTVGVQLLQANAPVKLTPTDTTTPSSANESATERKARLARLERMQEELRKDYEKREARKEEAQRERRRLRMKEISSRGVVTKSVATVVENVTKNSPAAGITPSQARARIQSDDLTPSAARANSAVKSRNASVERSRTSNKGTNFTPAAKSSVNRNRRNKQNATPLKVHVSSPDVHIENDHDEKDTTAEEEAALNDNESLSNHFEVEPEELKSKKINHTSKTTPAARLPRSVPRPVTTLAKPTTSSLSPKRSVVKNDKSNESKAFEDWKKKESEEWALVKNMRRRQEAALREAEGERERAKAWAASERESTKKWVQEQRAIIKKDRHKASNAALLASKRADKNKAANEADATNTERELEELRSQVTKLRMEAYEAKKLKDQVRMHEKTIAALRNANKSATSKIAEQRVFKDCTSSKTNKPKSALKPKSPMNSHDGPSPREFPTEQAQRKPLGIIVDTSNGVYMSDEEEDTDICLESNLNELNGAKNDVNWTDANQQMSKNNETTGRKPYNAADYGATTIEMPPSNAHTPIQPTRTASPSFSNLNGAPSGTPKSSQFFTYQNGTQKEVLSDGTTTVYFTNGDRKRTYANEKKGIVVYYYAATQTTQVTHQDGKQTYHFPNKQIEDHHVDGTKEISYPDGTKRVIYTDGTTDTTFPDGVRVVDYPDGRQQVHQVC